MPKTTNIVLVMVSTSYRGLSGGHLFLRHDVDERTIQDRPRGRPLIITSEKVTFLPVR